MKIKNLTKKVKLTQLTMFLVVTFILIGGILIFAGPEPASGVASNEVAWATDVTAGGSHSCAIYNLGTPYCWGDNSDGQLGTGDGINHSRPYPVNISGIPAGYVFKQISAGFFHTCAVAGLSGSDSSDAIYCWGKNDRGQLGLGVADSTLVTVPTAVTNPVGLVAKKVSAGFAHTCAIYGASGNNASNVAYCWGNNDEGQLGDGSGVYDTTSQTFTTLPTSYYSPHAVLTTQMSGSVMDISAGAMSSCASTSAGLFCWGAGGSGQLGDGDINSSSSPALTVSSGNSTASVGWFYGCAIISGAMNCWGDNTSGQLGTGNNTSTLIGVPVTSFGGSIVKQIATGYAHSCAITGDTSDDTNDALYCWGENADGQILNGTTGVSTNMPEAADLYNVPSGYIPKKVATGWAHTMAIYSLPDNQVSGEVYGCGDNSSGQVGDNTTNSCDIMVPIDTTDVAGIDISLDLEVSGVAFSVSPSSTGESGHNVATVTTELPTGYTLTMQSNGANLVCSSGSAAGQTIPSLAANGVFPAGESHWGWNLGTYSAGAWQAPTTWQTVPVATPAMIASTNNASATAGDDYGIFFGVRVDAATQPCDSYDQTLVLTATMNV